METNCQFYTGSVSFSYIYIILMVCKPKNVERDENKKLHKMPQLDIVVRKSHF